MLTKSNCLICESDNWSELERYKYVKSETTLKFSISDRLGKYIKRFILRRKPRREIVATHPTSGYQLKRWKVIFDVWFPDQDEVYLSSKYCKVCGYATYFPRPTDEDIANKYNYLKKLNVNHGSQQGYSQYALGLDLERASRIYNTVQPFIHKGKLNILDYGGGNGKLMFNFLKNNHNCYIIDYNDNTLEGVIKIGDDHNNSKCDVEFDVVICSHVLEHVSNLKKVISFIRNNLTENGILYAEVPSEVWAGISLEYDPVTHINFFTKNSFQNLFIKNGFEIMLSQRKFSTYGDYSLEVLWLVAKKSVNPNENVLDTDIQVYLYPSLLYSANKVLKTKIVPKVKQLFKT